MRGLTVSASLGLIATKEFNMSATTWAVVRNVELNHGGAAGATKTVSVTVRAQTNGVGGCGDDSSKQIAATDAATPPPPPPPLPPAKPLKLTFSLGAPSPLGGADAVAIGSMMLVNGTVLPGGGAESGLYSRSGSGPWCAFTAELQLPASVETGSVHDLYVSMLAENTTLQRFTLDHFKLRA